MTKYAFSTNFYLDIPYTLIEWVHVEGSELRMEDGVWVEHTVTRCVFARGLPMKYAKCQLAFPIDDTPEPAVVVQPDPYARIAALAATCTVTATVANDEEWGF